MMLLRAPRWALEILLKSFKEVVFHWVFIGLVVSMFSLLWWYIIKIKHAVNSPNLWKLNEKCKFLTIFKEFSRSILESKKASLIRLNFTFVEKNQHIGRTSLNLVFKTFDPVLNMQIESCKIHLVFIGFVKFNRINDAFEGSKMGLRNSFEIL